MPKGLITRLLLNSQSRGRDSVGLAFRSGERSTAWCRHAVSPKIFTDSKKNQSMLGEARRSISGIAHVRNASPGLPINDSNAHPFKVWKTLFAHNGRITNYTQVQQALIDHYQSEVERHSGDAEALSVAKWYLHYAQSITNDSMVIGPYIDQLDFSVLEGKMALIWMTGDTIRVLRTQKEACATTIYWRDKHMKDLQPDNVLTLVASEPHIIEKSIEACKVDFSMQPIKQFDEAVVYELEPTGLKKIKRVPVNKAPVHDCGEDKVAEPTTTVAANA